MDYGRTSYSFNRGSIEEAAGKRRFWLMPEEEILCFEKRMLCESGCPYTLPMYFITEEERTKAYYDFTGCVQMEEYLKRKTIDCKSRESGTEVREILRLMSGILDCLKGLDRYLLFPERYSIHQDAFFVSLESGRVSLAFYPNDKKELTLQDRIILLIDWMKDFLCSDETGRYLTTLKSFIESRNPGLDSLISMVGTMQREAGYIYWADTALRSSDRKEPEEIHEKAKSISLKSGKLSLHKPAAVQAAAAAFLAAVFLSGYFDPVSFAGLTIITAGVDLWVLRRLHFL